MNGVFLVSGKILEPIFPSLQHAGFLQVDERSVDQIGRPSARSELRSEPFEPVGAGHHGLFHFYERIGFLERAEDGFTFVRPPSRDDIKRPFFLSRVDQRSAAWPEWPQDGLAPARGK